MPDRIRRASDLGGGPAHLLPLVFARPREALSGARRILAAHPAPHDASIAHQVIGLVERDFGDAAAAVVELRLAVRLARRAASAPREADALAALGVALIHSGRTRAGLSRLDAAVRLATGADAARVRFRRARALWVLGRHDAALADLRRALPVLRRADDPIWTARALTLRALIRLSQGAAAAAEDDLGLAERLFATTDQAHDVAVAVHNRGLVAFRAGDLPAALAHLDDAAARYRRLGTPAPDLTADRCAVLLTAGLAREALEVADAGVRELDSLRGQATRKAELLLMAGRAALAASEPETARTRASAAGRLFAAQGRAWWAVHSRLVLLQSRLAEHRDTDLDAPVAPAPVAPAPVAPTPVAPTPVAPALSRLVAEAARTARQLEELGSPESGQAHLLAGRAALALGSPAIATRDRTGDDARMSKHPRARGGGWLERADAHLAVAARDRGRGSALVRATGWLAEALRAEAADDPQRTLEACRRGLDVLARHQLSLGGSELRAQSTARGSELAAVALRTSLRGGGARRLLEWCERWRAIALAVPAARGGPDAGLQAELVRYRGVTSRVAEAEAAGQAAPHLRRAQAGLERRIRARAMRQPGNGGAPERLLVPRLLDALGDTRMAELVDVDGRLYVLLCHRGRIRRFAAGRTAEVAAELEFAQAGLRRMALGGRAVSGQRLQELLLGPAASQLGDGPAVIVPPAWMHAMPWALLPALRPIPVSVAPSARSWLRARAVPEPVRPGQRNAAQQPEAGNATAGPGQHNATQQPEAGNAAASPGRRDAARQPEAGNVAARPDRRDAAQRPGVDVAPLYPGDVVLVAGPNLAAGPQEVAAIAKLYEQPTVLDGERATAARVLEALGGSRLAHIAAHGTFRADSPLFSALHLHDGPLTVHDFERMPAAPYRLVLSACDSARLAPSGADELLGLAAALLPLGTAAIVASVVPVDDEATSGLMQTLHRGLRAGLGPAEALCAMRADAAGDPLAVATACAFMAIGAA
ncbi:CHAT domain-containing protein [Dactylosporangium sp. CS-033363]|uniref:CHAT domain-containing protein n=1 Tax=Dactylosporangium sp. CS-033363 TaxID=3239935 RepID=UPI003D92DC0F